MQKIVKHHKSLILEPWESRYSYVRETQSLSPHKVRGDIMFFMRVLGSASDSIGSGTKLFTLRDSADPGFKVSGSKDSKPTKPEILKPSSHESKREGRVPPKKQTPKPPQKSKTTNTNRQQPSTTQAHKPNNFLEDDGHV